MSAELDTVATAVLSPRSARHERGAAWRKRQRKAILGWLEPLAVTIAILLLAELLIRTGVIDSPIFPPISEVIGALFEDLFGPQLWAALWLTIVPWAQGLAIVVAIAIPVGILIGLSRIAYGLTYLLFDLLRITPTVAAIPLLILLFGVGQSLTVCLVVLTALWPLLLQTMYGARDVDPVTVDTAQVYGLSRMQIVRSVVIPSAVPFIATGARLAAVIAFVVAIAASIIAGGGGLGYAILVAANTGNTPLMWARVAVAGIIGVLLTAALRAIEGRLLRWRRDNGDVL